MATTVNEDRKYIIFARNGAHQSDVCLAYVINFLLFFLLRRSGHGLFAGRNSIIAFSNSCSNGTTRMAFIEKGALNTFRFEWTYHGQAIQGRESVVRRFAQSKHHSTHTHTHTSHIHFIAILSIFIVIALNKERRRDGRRRRLRHSNEDFPFFRIQNQTICSAPIVWHLSNWWVFNVVNKLMISACRRHSIGRNVCSRSLFRNDTDEIFIADFRSTDPK